VGSEHSNIKSRDVIFDELKQIERTTLHVSKEDNTPNLWVVDGILPNFSNIPRLTSDEEVNEREEGNVEERSDEEAEVEEELDEDNEA
jgi:hypothetical protein